jgi:hypothetical protein
MARLHDGPAANLEYEDIPTFTQDNIPASRRAADVISGYYWFSAGTARGSGCQFLHARVTVWPMSGGCRPALWKLACFVPIHPDQVDYAGYHEGAAGPALG